MNFGNWVPQTSKAAGGLCTVLCTSRSRVDAICWRQGSPPSPELTLRLQCSQRWSPTAGAAPEPRGQTISGPSSAFHDGKEERGGVLNAGVCQTPRDVGTHSGQGGTHSGVGGVCVRGRAV